MVWPEVAMGEVCEEITVGFVGPMATEYREAGVPFLRSMNVDPFRINRIDLKYISPEFHARIKKSRLRAGDVVIVRTGDPGKAAVVPDWMHDGNCSDLVIARPGPEVDAEYLCYYVNAVSHHIVNEHAVGAVQQHFNVGSAKGLKLPLPPVSEQRAIARVLGRLDDKIELNRRMNRTLEDLARGLFRSWFVDFDPVTRNGSAKAPAAPAGLFPKRLVDSPLGPIPEGWRVGRVAELCTTQYGYTASASEDTFGPRMLRVTDMNKEPWIEWTGVPRCRIDDHLLPRYALKLGDILVSRMADPGKAAIVEEVRPEGAVFASYLIRLATRSIAASYYLFYYLWSNQYLDYVDSVSGGTVQKNMNAQLITAAQMVIAPDEIADEFARMVRPWRARIAANLLEARSLAALRDALLPQLLSGELRLCEAEKTVEVAV